MGTPRLVIWIVSPLETLFRKALRWVFASDAPTLVIRPSSKLQIINQSVRVCDDGFVVVRHLLGRISSFQATTAEDYCRARKEEKNFVSIQIRFRPDGPE